MLGDVRNMLKREWSGKIYFWRSCQSQLESGIMFREAKCRDYRRGNPATVARPYMLGRATLLAMIKKINFPTPY